MTRYVLLTIEDDAEAGRLLEDIAAYPGHTLLTPVQENDVLVSEAREVPPASVVPTP